jgi:AraC-like DNA-binding protein
VRRDGGGPAGRTGPGNMPESLFISRDADVGIIQHLRYLPPRMHAHEFIEIAYLYEGRADHSIGESKLTMEPGDVCLIAPGRRHSVSVFDDDTIMVNVLMRRSRFDVAFLGLLEQDDLLSEFFTRLIHQADETASYVLFRSGADQRLRGVVEDLVRESDSTDRYRSHVMTILATLFCTMLIRDHEGDVVVYEPTGTERDERIVRALRYVQANYATVTRSEVAERFGYTEGHFSKLVHRYTGRTFAEIIRETRVKWAEILLRDLDMPVREIVERVGYADISHFYRSFKKEFGTTPAEYRRRVAARS